MSLWISSQAQGLWHTPGRSGHSSQIYLCAMRNSVLCSLMCSTLVRTVRLPMESFRASRSIWCKTIPGGIGPFALSHTTGPRNRHEFGSATLTNARLFPPLHFRILTEPTGYLHFMEWPGLNSVSGERCSPVNPLFHGLEPTENDVELGPLDAASLLPAICARLRMARHALLHVFRRPAALAGTSNEERQVSHVSTLRFFFIRSLQGALSGTRLYHGSGTTGEVCERLGRKWLGIELNPEYGAMSARRTAQRGLLFAPDTPRDAYDQTTLDYE